MAERRGASESGPVDFMERVEFLRENPVEERLEPLGIAVDFVVKQVKRKADKDNCALPVDCCDIRHADVPGGHIGGVGLKVIEIPGIDTPVDRTHENQMERRSRLSMNANCG